MLSDLLEAEKRDLEWRAYTADTLGAIMTRIFRWSGADESFDPPLYTDLHKPPPEKLSSDQIKERVVGKLLHGKEGKK